MTKHDEDRDENFRKITWTEKKSNKEVLNMVHRPRKVIIMIRISSIKVFGGFV